MDNQQHFIDNRQLIFNNKTLIPDHHKISTVLQQGQFLAQVLYVSTEPVMQVWLAKARTYLPAIQDNHVFYAFGVAKIIQSKSPYYQAGDYIFGQTTCQQYIIYSPDDSILTISTKQLNYELISFFYKVPAIVATNFTPDEMLYLVHLGLTSYVGMIKVGKMEKNQTVVINSAAGATGLLCCQLAKIYNCQTIGITGSDEKTKFLSNLGIQTINYKTQDIGKELKQLAPKGVDLFFDNVGENQLETLLRHMKNKGNVVLCGAISNYLSYKNRGGVRNSSLIVTKGLTVSGFVPTIYAHEYDQILCDLVEFKKQGKLFLKIYSYQGIEHVAESLAMVFRGENIGKVMVNLFPEPKSKL